MLKAKNLENTLHDIKTLFDGIKHLGLCATIAIGLQWLQEPMVSAGLSHWLRVFVNWLGLGLAIYLTGMAMFWLSLSFRSEPHSKILNRIALMVLGAATLLVMTALIFSALKNVPFEP